MGEQLWLEILSVTPGPHHHTSHPSCPPALQPKPLTTSRRMAAPTGGGGEEEPSTPPTSARALGGATFWDAPGTARDYGGGGSDRGPDSAGGGGGFASPPILTPGTTRSRHVVKPIRGQQAEQQQHAVASAGGLSFSLLRTPRGGIASDASASHRTPVGRADGSHAGGSARLAEVPDGDEDADD